MIVLKINPFLPQWFCEGLHPECKTHILLNDTGDDNPYWRCVIQKVDKNDRLRFPNEPDCLIVYIRIGGINPMLDRA